MLIITASILGLTDCSFRYTSPYLWNQLPTSLRQPSASQSVTDSSTTDSSTITQRLSNQSPLSSVGSVWSSAWVFNLWSADPRGPRGAFKGSAGNPRKTGDPSHFSPNKNTGHINVVATGYNVQHWKLRWCLLLYVIWVRSFINKTCSVRTRSTKGWSWCALGRGVRHPSLEFLWVHSVLSSSGI